MMKLEILALFWTRRLVLALAGLACCAGPALAAVSGVSAPATAEVTLHADWAVRLEADGQGSDARGAQLLVLLGALGGSDGIGQAQDAVTLPSDGDGPYRVDSTLTPRGALAVLLRRLHWVRSASGRMADGQAELLTASSQRGDAAPMTARVSGGRLALRDGNAPVHDKPAPDGLLDPLSLGWGYLLRPLPTQPFTLPLLINDGVQTAEVVPRAATLQWQGQPVACVLLDARSNDSSAKLRIWLRKSDGLPLQIELGMGERYGLNVVQTLARVPDGLAQLHVGRIAAR